MKDLLKSFFFETVLPLAFGYGAAAGFPQSNKLVTILIIVGAVTGYWVVLGLVRVFIFQPKRENDQH